MTLCDAGPLFALVDPRQAVLHQRCKAALSHLRSPLITTWPSFTEAMYLAHRSGGWPMQNLLWQYVREAVLWPFTGVVAVALPRSSRASTDTTGRPLVFQATVPGLFPLRAA